MLRRKARAHEDVTWEDRDGHERTLWGKRGTRHAAVREDWGRDSGGLSRRCRSSVAKEYLAA